MNTATPPPRRTLLLYRDAALLPVIDHPGVLPDRSGLVIELATRSRLRVATGEPPISLRRPVVHATVQHHRVPAVLAAVERCARGVVGEVVFVCHVDDAPLVVRALDPVDAVNLVWHPSDRLDGSARRALADAGAAHGPAVDTAPVILWDPAGGRPLRVSGSVDPDTELLDDADFDAAVAVRVELPTTPMAWSDFC